MRPLLLRIRRKIFLVPWIRRRSILHVLWALPCVWLLRTLFERPECWLDNRNVAVSEESSHPCQPRRGSSPKARSRTVDAIGSTLSSTGRITYCSSSTFPERIEPIGRPQELFERLTGAEIIMKLDRANGINKTVAATAAAISLDVATSPGAGSRCSAVDFAVLSTTMACGSPLSSPCFDRERCRTREPLVYVYDDTCSLAPSSALPPSNESLMLSHSWREAARNAGVLAERYSEACLFISINKLIDRPPCATNSPLWNGGSNHVMVDLTDRTRDAKPEIAESLAMDASSNMLSCYYRTGYDFSVPLRHKLDSRNLTEVAPWEREYFATVKGNLYLSGYGVHERLSLVPLHSEPHGVVVALKCFELHDEHLLPRNVEFCDTLNETSARHDFADLMNTTFGLVPAGRSPATYRLAEVMSAGAIPVFVNRDYVRPFPERVDWSSFSFTFSPEEVGRSMMETLRAVSPEGLWEMQGRSLEAFLDIFGEEPGYSRIAGVVIEELIRRVGYH